MSEYYASKQGNRYVLKDYFSHEQLTQITHSTAKLIHNGYISVYDNILQSGGFTVASHGMGLEYADSVTELNGMLLRAEKQLFGFVATCDDLE